MGTEELCIQEMRLMNWGVFCCLFSLFKQHFSGKIHFPSGNSGPKVAKIAFPFSSWSLLHGFLKRRIFELEVMLVNSTGQSFQRKIHLQPFLRLVKGVLWPFLFFPREQDWNSDPNLKPVALSFRQLSTPYSPQSLQETLGFRIELTYNKLLILC